MLLSVSSVTTLVYSGKLAVVVVELQTSAAAVVCDLALPGGIVTLPGPQCHIIDATSLVGRVVVGIHSDQAYTNMRW